MKLQEASSLAVEGLTVVDHGAPECANREPNHSDHRHQRNCQGDVLGNRQSVRRLKPLDQVAGESQHVITDGHDGKPLDGLLQAKLHLRSPVHALQQIPILRFQCDIDPGPEQIAGPRDPAAQGLNSPRQIIHGFDRRLEPGEHVLCHRLQARLAFEPERLGPLADQFLISPRRAEAVIE